MLRVHCVSPFDSAQSPCPGVVLPTFKEGLPSSVTPLETLQHSQVHLLGDSQSCHVDNSRNGAAPGIPLIGMMRSDARVFQVCGLAPGSESLLPLSWNGHGIFLRPLCRHFSCCTEPGSLFLQFHHCLFGRVLSMKILEREKLATMATEATKAQVFGRLLCCSDGAAACCPQPGACL